MEAKKCVIEPLPEGTECGAPGAAVLWTTCNEGPGVCKTIETENGPSGRCFGTPLVGEACNDENDCTGAFAQH